MKKRQYKKKNPDSIHRVYFSGSEMDNVWTYEGSYGKKKLHILDWKNFIGSSNLNLNIMATIVISIFNLLSVTYENKFAEFIYEIDLGSENKKISDVIVRRVKK